MNIQEAKREICNTLKAYLSKDENGNYTYPVIRQRPVLLMGPPGIGKTAIMEQAARECGVGLVSYTITHHTRQSAIGLPEIVKKTYGGREMTVTEYTMSEIVASVYDCMEHTGKKEGILFIDEINCASETLAPVMLALLQNKTFGSHKIPDGWVLAAAGNPPQYNKSVREFDIVTLDRVREISIEPDCDVWLKYAWKNKIHQSIISYLSLKKQNFYIVENTGESKTFVTARGWEDLSRLIEGYEELDVPVTEELTGQFIHKEEIARDFCLYYRLYTKYDTDYGISGILKGNLDRDEMLKKENMASKGSFEERFTVVHLVLAALISDLEEYSDQDGLVTGLYSILGHLKKYLESYADIGCTEEFILQQKKSLQVKMEKELISPRQYREQKKIHKKLEEYIIKIKEEHINNAEKGWERIKTYFQEEVIKRKSLAAGYSKELDRAFEFIRDSFGDDQEMVLFVSEITQNPQIIDFIGQFGCDFYFKYSDRFLGNTQEKALREECINILNWK